MTVPINASKQTDRDAEGHEPAAIGRRTARTQRANVAAHVAVAVLFASTPPVGHTQDVPREFEVASVKRSAAATGGGIRALPDLYDARNVPLRTIILMAYNLRDYQLIDAPAWTRERFDVVARTRGPVSPAAMLPLLRALLAERFQLRAHEETRTLPVYALQLAHTDGSLGPRIRVHTADCGALLGGRPPAWPAPSGPMDLIPCGSFMTPTSYAGGDASMSAIATGLSTLVGRPVLDRTGVTGTFDFHTTFEPDPTVRFNNAPAPSVTDAPSIYTAVQEQLGVRLEATTAPVDVVIIDQIEPPQPD